MSTEAKQIIQDMQDNVNKLKLDPKVSQTTLQELEEELTELLQILEET